MTHLARTAQVVDATAADFRVLRVAADVGAEVPATAALGVTRLDHFQLEAFDFGGHSIRWRLHERHHAGGRRDQHEAQFVAQLAQVGAQAFVGVQGDFGLQVAADDLGGTLVFQAPC